MASKSLRICFVEPANAEQVLSYYEETDDANNIERSVEELRRAARQRLLFGVYDDAGLVGVAGAFWLDDEHEDVELGGTHLRPVVQGLGLQKRILIPLRVASILVLDPPENQIWSAVKPDNIASLKSLQFNGFVEGDPIEKLFKPCEGCKEPPKESDDRRCCCDMLSIYFEGAQKSIGQLLELVDEAGIGEFEKAETSVRLDCQSIDLLTEESHRKALRELESGDWVPPCWYTD